MSGFRSEETVHAEAATRWWGGGTDLQYTEESHGPPKDRPAPRRRSACEHERERDMILEERGGGEV